jgi:RNA polymerase sporulation-specific sigma factor
MRARNYFIAGADHDDVVQEGMIGLYKAVRDFRADKLASFRAFADLCITRQILTAVKTATRMKHAPLNQSVSINKPQYQGDDARTLLDMLESPTSRDPEDVLIKHELRGSVRERIQRSLSELEAKVLSLYLEGMTYSEMCGALNRRSKSIDNSLQRIKRKIEKDRAVAALLSPLEENA